MPLTVAVRFKTLLQMGNRVQVPKLVRWQFKLDSTQVLKVAVSVETGVFMKTESFYAKMSEDGRITVPMLQLVLLQKESGTRKSLVGCVFEVKIEPSEGQTEMH